MGAQTTAARTRDGYSKHRVLLELGKDSAGRPSGGSDAASRGVGGITKHAGTRGAISESLAHTRAVR